MEILLNQYAPIKSGFPSLFRSPKLELYPLYFHIAVVASVTGVKKFIVELPEFGKRTPLLLAGIFESMSV